MNTPERTFKKNNFNSFSYLNTDSFKNPGRSEFPTAQNLQSPQIDDKQSKYSFVVDWQINKQDVKF
jgi:hypothetical protein